MHYEGSPDGCGETCTGPHLDDTPSDWPECCGDCGGNGGRCYPTCRERVLNRPFEPWEGHTGEQEYAQAW